MKTTLVKMFPTTSSVTENFLTPEEVEYLLQMVKNTKSKDHSLLLGDATSSWDTGNILEKDTPIHDKITKKLKEYTSAMGLYDTSIVHSWFNIQKPNSMLDVHNHHNSKISGALYLQVDEDSSELIFHDMHPFHNLRERTQDNEFNFHRFSIKPTGGMLVLFPSWLNHSSGINQSKERIVISFNADTLILLPLDEWEKDMRQQEKLN